MNMKPKLRFSFECEMTSSIRNFSKNPRGDYTLNNILTWPVFNFKTYNYHTWNMIY